MTVSLLLEHFDNLLATPEDSEQLNRAILELAIHGKLTHREAGDDLVKELLKQICNDKEKLGKGEPVIPVKDSDKPFELPDGWEWARVGDITTIRGGKRLPKGFDLLDTPTEHIYIRVTDMKNGSIKDSNLKYISDEVYKQIQQYIIERGDLYITIAGTIGAIGDVPEKFHGMNLTENAARITPYRVEKSYLKLCLSSQFVQIQLQDKVNQMAQPKLALTRIKTTLIPIPSLAEQQRIVARVEELFAQTRALAKELAHSQIELDGLNKSALSYLLASETPEDFNQHWDFIAEHFDLLFETPEHVAPLRQSILELAVRGKLTRREAGDESAGELLKRIREEKEKLGKKETLSPIKEREEPFTLPDGWEWARFGDITVNRDGERIPIAKEDREGRHGGYDYYGASGVIDNIDDFLFDKSLLLIGEDGANLVNRSTPIAFIAHGKYWVNNHAHVLDAIDYGTLKYLEVFINAIDLKPYLTGTAQPKMNQAKMNSIVVALPSLAEQERIVERVEQLLSLCDALEARLQSSEEERGRLVAAVMSTVGG